MNMIGKKAYPKLSSSPIMNILENFLFMGYKSISLKWKNVEKSTKDFSSNIEEQAAPKHFFHDEEDMIIIECPMRCLMQALNADV